jgi:gamma-glutamylcyclotransferase (GGCT)/AIG2-like uncharacterized protein YtfP
MKARVAVYGTLREGEYNHHILVKSGATLLGSTFIPGYLMLSLGMFPGIVPCKRDDWEVYVEIYEVDSPTLDKLDKLEGVGNDFYDRVKVDTILFGKVFLYVLSPKYFNLVYNSNRAIKMVMQGDWMEEELYELDDDDLRSEITEDYLQKAEIKPIQKVVPITQEVKQLPSPTQPTTPTVPESPILPPVKWDEVFGSVREAPIGEIANA